MLTIHNCTLRIHSCAQSVHSCVRLYDMKTDTSCVLQSKVRPHVRELWIKNLREEWTQNFKTSPAKEDDVEMNCISLSTCQPFHF